MATIMLSKTHPLIRSLLFTGGACSSSSPFGDTMLYDGVNVAGLLPMATNRPAMLIGQTAGVVTPLYGQPDLVNIRWPAPPLFPSEHQRRKQHIEPSSGEQQPNQVRKMVSDSLG